MTGNALSGSIGDRLVLRQVARMRVMHMSLG